LPRYDGESKADDAKPAERLWNTPLVIEGTDDETNNPFAVEK
jgi:hypothetical protein